jgi:hypothetical protein
LNMKMRKTTKEEEQGEDGNSWLRKMCQREEDHGRKIRRRSFEKTEVDGEV